MAEEDVLSAVELDLTVDPIADEAGSAGSEATAQSTEATPEPFFRVVKGSPTDEELAALVCVLSAVANSAAPAGPTGPPDLWGHPTLMHRGASPFSPYSFPQLSHLRG
ncbi:acyl-CoA carboxylase subunit epsilon [Nocardia beijingensis]|uniref:acyl-CoA carboxylase subunit epsilon n=1 Tax=Nocardia beijingensis TaxID=95162 RepID=UPI003D9EC996